MKKKSKLKSPKRKVIPHCYQKKSNTSLSKLLHIATYKKRINDLVYNNRRLARELQGAKCEIASQTNLLEDNAKNRNHVMFATLKLQDMANSITKLVTDLDEVRNYLHNALSSDEIKFPPKGFQYPKKLVPTIDCIEEASVLSSLDSSNVNTPPPPVIPSQFYHSTCGKRKSSNETLLTCSQAEDQERCDVSVDLPPILFVEDNENVIEKNMKKSSKTKSSEQQGKEDNGSLTPELDIDINFSCLKRKKSNSRRQTQFKLSDPRKTNSKGKSSPSEVFPSEKDAECCPLSMAASSNSCQTKVSNSRKNKSREKRSPEDTLPTLEHEQTDRCSLSYVASSNRQTLFEVSDAKKSKSRDKVSSEVDSPPLLFDEVSVKASSSKCHSLIKVSGSRKSRSRGRNSPKTSQSKKLSSEAPNSGKKSRNQISSSRQTSSREKLLPESMSPMCIQMPIKTAEKQKIDLDNSFKSCELENVNFSSNLHCITEKLPTRCGDLMTSDMPSDSATYKIMPGVTPNLGPVVAVTNATLLLCEDMELTDVIATNPIISDYSKGSKDCSYEIKSNAPENSDCSKETSNSKEPSKIDEMSEPSVENNASPTILKNVQQRSILGLNKILDVTEGNTLPLHGSFIVSSPKVTRCKNTVQYCFFSSSESEDEYVAKTSKSRKKRSSSGEKRETVIFKPDTVLKTSTALKNTSEPGENLAVEETSVFSFNISHSENNDMNQESNNVPKKSKLSRNKKNIKKNDFTMKPLSQSYNVTKLKGFNYKFSKTKSPIHSKKLSKDNKQKKSDSSSKMHASKLPTNVSPEKSLSFQEKNLIKSVENTYKSVLKDLSISENTPKKQDTNFMNVRSEGKRVSFAPTDLVCNFKKMSLSKAIAANAKERQASKSAAKFTDLFEEDAAEQPPSFHKLNDAEDTLFDFSGETELYTINLQSNVPCPALQDTDQQYSVKLDTSSVVEHNKDNLQYENLTNKNNKIKKGLKTRVVASQKKMLQTSSIKSNPEFEDIPKEHATKQSRSLSEIKDLVQPQCLDQINDTKDSLFDFPDATELNSFYFPSKNNCLAPQAIDQQTSSKISIPSTVEDNKEILSIHTKNLPNKNKKNLKTRFSSSQKKVLPKVSPAKCISPLKKFSVKSSRKSIKLYEHSKENYLQNNLETVRADKQIKQREPLSPIEHLLDYVDVRCIDKVERNVTSSVKSKKRATTKRVITKSAPVLKDYLESSILGIDASKTSIDFKDVANSERPKRRSKAPVYKEPALNKKMRRP